MASSPSPQRVAGGKAAQLAGRALQTAIEDAYAMWRPPEVYLRRTTPPAEIVGSGADRRLKYVGSGVPDYHAIVRGTACPFDAKSTCADAWEVAHAESQREALDAALAAGGHPGLYLQFRVGAGARDFWVPWSRVRDRTRVPLTEAPFLGVSVRGYAWWEAVSPLCAPGREGPCPSTTDPPRGP